jgi:putative addiction module antidote
MTASMKVRRIGNSLGVTMPREVTDHMHLREGDVVHAVTEPGGAMRLVPYDPVFEKGMEAFAEVRREYRNAFRALADK